MVTSPQAGQHIAGYRLLRCIGQGATSSVFLAEAPDGGAAVALKLVDLAAGGAAADEAGQSFLRAATAARSLQHPDIVAVHAAGLLPHRAWLAMEPVPGSDLSRYTRPARLLPARLVVRLSIRLARALEHAHQHGVVHRDLKPANVLVHWPNDTVKLADFGLARDLASEHSRTGVLLGSPAYMAPELLAGAVPAGSSDLYALGVLLFELLAGRRPHDSDSMGTLLRQIATVDAPDLREWCPALPAALALQVRRLLARPAAERPRSAEQVAQALQQVDAAWPHNA